MSPRQVALYFRWTPELCLSTVYSQETYTVLTMIVSPRASNRDKASEFPWMRLERKQFGDHQEMLPTGSLEPFPTLPYKLLPMHISQSLSKSNPLLCSVPSCLEEHLPCSYFPLQKHPSFSLGPSVYPPIAVLTYVLTRSAIRAVPLL